MDGAAHWQRILREAQALGIRHLACAKVADLPEHDLYTAWLAADLAGDMTYLGRDIEARRNPQRLLERARSVVSVALSYAHPDPVQSGPGLFGQIARYARAEDYHLVLKRRLHALAERIVQPLRAADENRVGIAYRICVDSAPLLERALGAQAGLGFIGKNTLLITPGVGSYTVLGELLLELDLAPGTAVAPRCGSCRLCLSACPTGAIIDEYRIDARRCISYLTIENTGPIPRSLRRAIGTWVFGCDICQEVCPWNASPSLRAGTGADAELAPLPQQSRPNLLWLLGLGAAQFRRYTRRTALRRIGRPQLLRNVAVALGNVGTAAEVPALLVALQCETALVRQHIAWALGEIAQRDVAAKNILAPVLCQALLREDDAAVQSELAEALMAIQP